MKKILFLITLMVTAATTYLRAASLSVENLTIQTGQNGQLTVSMTNTETNLSGFQFRLYLPEGLAIATNGNGKFQYTLGDRIAEHSLTIRVLNDGGYQFIAYSMDGDAIIGTSGVLLSVPVVPTENFVSGNGTISDIRLTDLDANKTTCSNVSFTVTKVIPAAGITLNKTTQTLNAANQTVTLTATVTPVNATNKSVTWSSSNTAVAMVDANGVVTAVSNGTATITAKTNDGSNLSATCEVTVDIQESSEFSNYKLYTLTCKRGGLVMNANGTGLAAGQTRIDAPETDKSFAIITYNGEYFLYSPTAKQFLLYDGHFASRLGSPITFDDSKADGGYKFMLSTQGTNGETWYFNNNGEIVICDWSLPDDGNRWLIEPVADFDPTEALTMAGLKLYTVTYEVLYEGKVAATGIEKVTSGSKLPTVPYPLANSFVTLSEIGTHPTTVTKDLTIQYTAEWNGPFELSKSTTNAKWYNMHIRGGYYVCKQNIEPYYPVYAPGEALKTREYHWAFGGDPYHVKVYNRTTGFTETLTKDGENVVMREGDYTWDLLPNSDGFVLRETGTLYKCIHHHSRDYMGALKFWNDPWSLTDDGSTFQVEEAQSLNDVVVTTDISQMDNAIYIERTEGMAGSSVSLKVKLKNVLTPNGCAFKLNLPTGFSLVKDTDGDVIYELSDRTKKMSVTMQDMQNGSYNVALTPSTGTATISGADGTVITFRIQIPEGIAQGDYKMELTNNIIQSKVSDTTQDYAVADIKTTFTVVDYILGDVNGDGNVTPADAIMILYHYFNVLQEGFKEAVADINRDGNITPADAIEALYIYFGVSNANAVKSFINDMLNPE